MKSEFKPYYAVIFTSKRTKDFSEDYEIIAERMEQLAQTQKGFLGVESARNNIGITVSYWETLDDIKNWKLHLEHQVAQKNGKSKWYSWYTVRVCKVEREYDFTLTETL